MKKVGRKLEFEMSVEAFIEITSEILTRGN